MVERPRKTMRERETGRADKPKPDFITHFLFLTLSHSHIFMKYCAALRGIAYKRNILSVRKKRR